MLYYVIAYIHYDLQVSCGLQNCTDVLAGVPDQCTDTCVTACVAGHKMAVVKVEEGSYIPEEEDPLALAVPATKAEQEVCYVPCTSCCRPEPFGQRWCQNYPIRICGWIWTVLTEVFINFLRASEIVEGC